MSEESETFELGRRKESDEFKELRNWEDEE